MPAFLLAAETTANAYVNWYQWISFQLFRGGIYRPERFGNIGTNIYMPFGGIDRKVIRVIELKKPLACRRSPWPRRPPKGDMYIWLTVAVQI